MKRLSKAERITAYGIYLMSDLIQSIGHDLWPNKKDDSIDEVFEFAESHYYKYTSSKYYYYEDLTHPEAMELYLNEVITLTYNKSLAKLKERYDIA